MQFLGENKNNVFVVSAASAEHTDVLWDAWEQRVILLLYAFRSLHNIPQHGFVSVPSTRRFLCAQGMQ